MNLIIYLKDSFYEKILSKDIVNSKDALIL